MTLLDYDSKESKQGRLYNTRTEQLYGHNGNNRNNRSAFLQTRVRSTSIDIKKEKDFGNRDKYLFNRIQLVNSEVE
ncbi:hypothetical protein O93_00827 [Bartonella quintana JK 19]|nr:hypothetical protein O93_00827 [Bartonella quintana JK 19]KEC68699.1 hypothetical protein O7Q_00481 [Bartonella quintana JK 39]